MSEKSYFSKYLSADYLNTFFASFMYKANFQVFDFISTLITSMDSASFLSVCIGHDLLEWEGLRRVRVTNRKKEVLMTRRDKGSWRGKAYRVFQDDGPNFKARDFKSSPSSWNILYLKHLLTEEKQWVGDFVSFIAKLENTVHGVIFTSSLPIHSFVSTGMSSPFHWMWFSF